MSFGGVQRVVKNLIDGFCGEYGITLVLFEKKPIEFALPANVQVEYLAERRFDYGALMARSEAEILTFGRELFAFRVESLCAVLERLQPDILLSHEDYDNLVTMESLARLGLKTPAILTSHIFLESYKAKPIHLMDWAFYESGIKKHYKNAQVVAVSSGVGAGLHALGIASTIIPNGVNIAEAKERAKEGIAVQFQNSSSQQELPHDGCPETSYFDPSGQIVSSSCFETAYEPYILCIGRIEFSQKGQDDLFKAYAKIAERIPHKLLFVGEGKDKAKLESLVAESGLNEQVEILGFQKNPFAFMKHAALVAFPSYFEGLPNTILEALAVGAAIVSYDFEPSAREISEDGRYFPLIPRGDVDGLAEKLEAILSDAATLESWRSLSKERAEAYGLESMLGKWREMIDASA